jgi:Ni2+-binding GTPase involved in maturation of urease and hydrogenase
MNKLQLFLAGGFLGSGKTTAILQAAQYLHKNGKKVGVITNDQGMQQVDTQFIKGHQIPSGEVANGCFCCHYNELHKNMESLQQLEKTEIIFAESVGSCTDLAATVVNPLLHFNPGRYEIVLSVFADIRLLTRFLKDGKSIFDDNVNYIYAHQLEEADIIVVNKIDLLPANQLEEARRLIKAEYQGKEILFQNSLSEESVRQWLAACSQLNNAALRSSAWIDYDTYGAGEAKLAWLDEELGFVTADKNAGKAAGIFVKKVYEKIVARGYPVGHLKFLVDDGIKQEKISYTAVPAADQADVTDMEADRVIILVNARIQVEPVLLQAIVNDAILETEQEAGCMITEHHLSVFQPGYPRPTYRMPFNAG